MAHAPRTAPSSLSVQPLTQLLQETKNGRFNFGRVALRRFRPARQFEVRSTPARRFDDGAGIDQRRGEIPFPAPGTVYIDVTRAFQRTARATGLHPGACG